MAGLLLKAVTPKISFSTSTITLLKITAPTNQRLKLKGWSISFDGVSNTAQPIQVQLLRATTAGTFTSLTPVKVNTSDGETIQSTAGHTATVEPTASDVLDSQFVHPQTGYTDYPPFGLDYEVPGGAILTLRLVTPAAGADAIVTFWYEE